MRNKKTSNLRGDKRHMRKLSLLALLFVASCATELAGDSHDESVSASVSASASASVIHVVNRGDQQSELVLSASPDCGAKLAADHADTSVAKARRISVAAGELQRIPVGEMTYLCAGTNAVGYPVKSGAVYIESDGLIVEGPEARQ